MMLSKEREEKEMAQNLTNELMHRKNAFKDLMMIINFEGKNSKPMCDIYAMKDIFELIDGLDEKEFNALFSIYGMASNEGYNDGYRDGVWDAQNNSVHEEYCEGLDFTPDPDAIKEYYEEDEDEEDRL